MSSLCRGPVQKAKLCTQILRSSRQDGFLLLNGERGYIIVLLIAPLVRYSQPARGWNRSAHRPQHRSRLCADNSAGWIRSFVGQSGRRRDSGLCLSTRSSMEGTEMPEYRDVDGRSWNIDDWPGHSYKAMVINRAYRQSLFAVEDIRGQRQIFFRCEWCQRWITSAGIQGDHTAPQRLEQDAVQGLTAGLFSDSLYNLTLSCQECNGGTRKKAARQSRSSFKRDREAQDPQPVGGQ